MTVSFASEVIEATAISISKVCGGSQSKVTCITVKYILPPTEEKISALSSNLSKVIPEYTVHAAHEMLGNVYIICMKSNRNNVNIFKNSVHDLNPVGIPKKILYCYLTANPNRK